MKKDKQLEWINIIELLGKPIWDNTHKKMESIRWLQRRI